MNVNNKKEKKSSSLKKLFSFKKKNSKDESPRQLSAVQEFPEGSNNGINSVVDDDEYIEQSSFIEQDEVRDSLQQFSSRLDGRDSIYFDPVNMKAAIDSASSKSYDFEDDDDSQADFMSADGGNDDEMNDFLNDDELIEELDGAIEDEVEAIIALRYSTMDQEDEEDDENDQIDLPQPIRRQSVEEPPAAMFGWGGVQVAVHKKSIQEAETAENNTTRIRSISGNNNNRISTTSTTSGTFSKSNDSRIGHNFQCSECSACFIDKDDLDVHYNASHGRLDKSVCGNADDDNISVMNSFVCPECMSQFQTGSDLKTHFDTSHASPVTNHKEIPLKKDYDDEKEVISPEEGNVENQVSSGTSKFKARRASLLAAGKSLVKAARSAKAEETILKVSRRVTLAAGGLAHNKAMQQANQAAADDRHSKSSNNIGGDHLHSEDNEFEVSDTDLLHSFASLLGSLKDPAYLKQFVEERDGVNTLATMANHIVQDAEERARQLGRYEEDDFSDSDDE